MTRKTLIFSIVITLLFAVLAFSVAGNYVSWLSAKSIAQKANTYRFNEKVLDFTKMFITLVLKTDGGISFDNRLKLENAVRDIGDKSILSQWQKFTKAGSDQEAEQEAKSLFQLLLDKINQ